MSEPPPPDDNSRPARGFARLTPERRAEIARQGARASVASGRGHRFNTESAKIAGRKGGLAKRDNADG